MRNTVNYAGKICFIFSLVLLLNGGLRAQTIVNVLVDQPPKLDIIANNLYTQTTNTLILGDSVTVVGGVTPYQYSWLKNGVLIGTSLVLTIPITNLTSSFTLNVKDTNNCSCSKSTIFTDINNIPSDTSKILVYPNPASNYLFIDPKKINGKLSVLIYDNKGSFLISRQISGVSKIIFDLPSGLYFIKISDSKNQIVVLKKFMVS